MPDCDSAPVLPEGDDSQSSSAVRVSVLIPAYNEAERLTPTIDVYYAALAARYGDAFELLIVANGCTDRTYEVAQELASSRPCLRVYETREKIGKGGAVLWGFSLARAPVVAFVDADASTAPESLLRLLAGVECEGLDVAVGSRWLPESVIPRKQPLKRRILSRIFNGLVRVLLPLPLRDTQCGAKAFRRALVADISSYVQGKGWAFDVELLLRLRQRYPKLRMREVPITWNDVSGSRLRAHTDGPSMLRDLLRLCRSKPVPPAGANEPTPREGQDGTPGH